MKKNLLTILFLLFASLNLLIAQTFQFGVNGNYNASQYLTPTIKYSGADSSYILSGGFGAGLSAAIFFDDGGYYSKKIYGIRLEGIYTKANQSYKIFPGQGSIDPDIFYQYRLKMSYIDVPVLFTLSPTHHQGLTVEAGPQISFLQNVSSQIEESRNTEPFVPFTSKEYFRPINFSFVAGAGIFYSFTEAFALIGTLRAGYSLSKLTNKGINNISVTPRRRLSLGINVQAIYKINKYDAKKNKGYKYYMKRIQKSR
ncbi:MAG: outer membrane beta-barrel protein [Bacteroidia bacterium]